MKNQPAFTLLEIIIVIAIVAMMAALAVGSYGANRLRARLDLTTDLLVSSVKKQQSLAKSGKALSCYGIVFDTKAVTAEAVQLVETPYVAVFGNVVDVCDFTKPTLTEFELIDKFRIAKIEEQKTMDAVAQEVERVALVFKPPLAKLILGSSFNNLVAPSQSLPVANPLLKITVALPTGQDTETRVFVVDSITGVSQKLDFSPRSGIADIL